MLIPIFDQQVLRHVVPAGLDKSEQEQFCDCASLVEEAMLNSNGSGSVPVKLPKVTRNIVIALAAKYCSIGLSDDFAPLGDGGWLFIVKV